MTERNTTAGVLEENGLFLVAKRKKGGPLSEKWEFIGGKNRYGETLEETLCREWLEEVGLEISVGEFLVRTEFTNAGTHYTLHCYRVQRVDDASEFVITVHDALRWVTPEELAALDFGPSDSIIRNHILSCMLENE